MDNELHPVNTFVERAPEIVEAIERLYLRTARRLLFDVASDSPLWDLPIPQLRTLFMVDHRRSCTMGDLAERLGVAMSTATQIADRLARRGWVRRADDPEDRRVVRLALTEAGQQVVDERRQQRRRWLEEALSQMPTDRQQALLVGLQALHDTGACSGGRDAKCTSALSLLDWVREDLEPALSGE